MENKNYGDDIEMHGCQAGGKKEEKLEHRKFGGQ